MPLFFDVCTTIETNRTYKVYMGNTPSQKERIEGLNDWTVKRYITIEPIMDFDLGPIVELIKSGNPQQVNIGADSGGNNLPEPGSMKIKLLIDELQKFTTVKIKHNLYRLLSK